MAANGKDTGEKKNSTTASAGAGVNRRTPERRLPSQYDNRSGRVGQGKNRGSTGSCRSAVQDGIPGVVDFAGSCSARNAKRSTGKVLHAAPIATWTWCIHFRPRKVTPLKQVKRHLQSKVA